MRLLLVVLFAGSCLALTELEQNVQAALQQARQNLLEQSKGLKTVKENGENPQSQKANGDSQQQQAQGDLLAEATKILVAKYGPEILSQLEEIDIEALLEETSARKKRYAAEPAQDGCIADNSMCNSQDK